MTRSINAVDAFASSLAQFVIRHRWLVIAATLLAVVAVGSGARHLDFANNYRAFFSTENPELVAFEAFQGTYTKNDNILFVLQPADGVVFSPTIAEAIGRVTEEAWQIPFSIRVDSLSNFQHTWSLDDDLTVEDLIAPGADLSPDELARIKSIALIEPLLKDNLIAADAETTGINVVLQYPEESLTEVPTAVAKARAIADGIRADYPELTVALTGVSMLNNSFAEAGVQDLMILVPLMYLILLVVMVVTLRSFSGTLATLFIIVFSSAAAVGAGGFMGIELTPISLTAPTIILTLAIADSVHILISLREALRQGMPKAAAIVEAMRINFLAVSITSLTTIVGFMALNLSDTPPFWHLGNMTAVGIAAAWLFSITFLPALMSLLPVRVKPAATPQVGRGAASLMERIADFVILRYRALLIGGGAIAVALTAMVPTIDLNDEWTKYFDDRVEFRRDADFAIEHLGGLYPIEFSVTAANVGGVSEPEFLSHLDAFTSWLRAQPEVTHVYSLSDIMKRLNRNMHGDDPNFYRVPDDRELAAQYLLLYELSLPYGLDLNDRINIDKSATRVTATLGDVSTVAVRAFNERADGWLRGNTPEYMWVNPTGATVMFSFIAKRNVESMLRGNAIAVILIAIIMVLALRNVRLGLLSLIPNAMPIAMTFGVWAILVGMVGMAAATVTATSLGIIVDNTVHLLTKYQRGIREKGLSVPDAIRYAFRTVGTAVAANAVILAIGFSVLALSTFKINAEMGLLTAIAVVIALIVDFFFLPALLMFGYNLRKGETHAVIQPSPAS
jgi:predicted RND superfamily exporter protein